MPFILDQSPAAAAGIGNALEGFTKTKILLDQQQREEDRFQQSMELENRKLEASVEEATLSRDLRRDLADTQAKLEEATLAQRGEFHADDLSLASRRLSSDESLARESLAQRGEFHADNLSLARRRISSHEYLTRESLDRRFPEVEQEYRERLMQLQTEQAELDALAGGSLMVGASQTATGRRAPRGINSSMAMPPSTPPVEQWMSKGDQEILAGLVRPNLDETNRLQVGFTARKRIEYLVEEERQRANQMDAWMASPPAGTNGNTLDSRALESAAQLRKDGQEGAAYGVMQAATHEWAARETVMSEAQFSLDATKRMISDSKVNLMEPNIAKDEMVDPAKPPQSKLRRISQLQAQINRVALFGQDPNGTISVQAAHEEIQAITEGEDYQKKRADRQAAEEQARADAAMLRQAKMQRAAPELIPMGVGRAVTENRRSVASNIKRARASGKIKPWSEKSSGMSEKQRRFVITRVAAAKDEAEALSIAMKLGIDPEDKEFGDLVGTYRNQIQVYLGDPPEHQTEDEEGFIISGPWGGIKKSWLKKLLPPM